MKNNESKITWKAFAKLHKLKKLKLILNHKKYQYFDQENT